MGPYPEVKAILIRFDIRGSVAGAEGCVQLRAGQEDCLLLLQPGRLRNVSVGYLSYVYFCFNKEIFH